VQRIRSVAWGRPTHGDALDREGPGGSPAADAGRGALELEFPRPARDVIIIVIVIVIVIVIAVVVAVVVVVTRIELELRNHQHAVVDASLLLERIEPAAIRRTALFTVEGERDDICSIGQMVDAHDLCSDIRPYMKNHHVQLGVGHYGVFSGRRWKTQINPRVREMIHDMH
jgi:hypothetical protein